VIRQATQQQNVEETQPLLGGQRLGGQRRPRLDTRNDSSGSEITRIGNDEIEFIPQTQQSMMSKIKEITSRKAKEATQQMLNIGSQISEGAQRVRQRISRRTKNDGRGNYTSNLENVPEGIEEPTIVGTFAKPEEHDAAKVLQGYLKKRPASQIKMMTERDEDLRRQTKHADKPLWKKTIEEARDINKHEQYMQTLKDKQERKAKMDDVAIKFKEKRKKTFLYFL
jgi:hypothetical protein